VEGFLCVSLPIVGQNSKYQILLVGKLDPLENKRHFTGTVRVHKDGNVIVLYKKQKNVDYKMIFALLSVLSLAMNEM